MQRPLSAPRSIAAKLAVCVIFWRLTAEFAESAEIFRFLCELRALRG
jgi:hypothetical protein